MLNIFYGRESLDKEKFIFDSLDRNGKNIIIVPDQFTLEMERDLFSYLKAECLMDTEVISMSRLGYKLLEELGGSKRRFIDKYGRHMILSRIVKEKGKALEAFRGLERKSSFIELANNFISELKQQNVKASDLESALSCFPEESYGRKKLSDLMLIFSEYEKEIEGKFTDSEDRIDLYLSKIGKSEYIKDSNIFIYGFDSLAPKALLVIAELLSFAKDVNIVLTYDRKDELFMLTGLVIKNLIEMAERRRIPCEVSEIDSSYEVTERAAGIKALEKELFRFRPKKHTEHDGITLVNAASIYNEAETIASHVLYLLREKNYRLSDIKIICNDQTLRIPVLKRMLKEYGLDLFSDSAVNISDTAIVQYVLSMISAVSTNFYSDGVLRVIKSGFTDLSSLEVMELENYAVKYRIKGNRWKEPFDRGVKEYKERLSFIESLRVKAVSPILRFEEICKADTNAQFIDSLYSFLIDDVKFTDRIESLINRQAENGRTDLADESAQVFGYMTGILEQIRDIAGDDPFDISDFLELFTIGLSEVSVGALPPTKDGLILGTMERTRIGHVKSLIIYGANEGVLPLEGSNEAVMNREERELLKEKGFEILKTESVTKMEEKLAIYRNFAKPLEELYITKSLGDAEGKKINASSVYTEILSIFGDEIEKKDILNSGDEKDLVSSHTAGLRHLTAELRRVSEGKELSPQWEKVLDWYKINDRESLDAVKRGIMFTNEIEPLDALKAKLLYTKGKEDISFGPTSIEGYIKCPFRFFLEKGLSLEERRIYEASSREIGDFSHLVVMEFTKRMKTEGFEITDPHSRWMTITPEEIKEEVDSIVEERILKFMEELFSFSDTEKYQAERMKNTLYRVCTILTYQVRRGAIKEIYFEESFGRGKRFEPISFETPNGTVYIEGKIDRVDILSGDRVKIIDYKTGDNRFNLDEARAGYQIQLMLYLKAAEENIRKPGAVFYFHVQDALVDFKNGKVDEGKLEQEIRKQYRMNGAVLNDEDVISSIESDFESASSVMTLSKTKDGFKKGSGIVLSEEEFSALENDVTDRIAQAVKRIAEGDIRIYPSRMKSDGKKNACNYCSYNGICRFDGDIPGPGFNDL